MKTFIPACVVALAALVAADDLVHVDQHDWRSVFENPPEWEDALQCILDKEPCGVWQQIKEGVVQRLQTDCGKCTPEQRVIHDDVVKRMKEKYPEDFQKIMDHIAKHYNN